MKVKCSSECCYPIVDSRLRSEETRVGPGTKSCISTKNVPGIRQCRHTETATFDCRLRMAGCFGQVSIETARRLGPPFEELNRKTVKTKWSHGLIKMNF